MDVLFPISVFRLYPGFKMSIEHTSVRKNLFLTASFCWDSSLSLSEMDRKFEFGGLIVYGNSYLDSIFRNSKVFRQHAILLDAAGAVRAQSGKGPGYCYMIGRGLNSCLLGHVTGLLFCRKNLSALHFQLCRFLKQLKKTTNIHNQRWAGRDFSRQILSKGAD